MEASEWSGRVGDIWAEQWQRTDRSFEPVNAALIAAALDRIGPTTAPSILDVGCGAGTTSLSLAGARPEASVTGLDLSEALLDVARSRAGGRGRVRFVHGDAARWDAGSGFDGIISRHGVMFFADPVAAFANLRARARSGGALLFSCFAAVEANLWLSGLPEEFRDGSGRSDAPGPFAFADESRVSGILSRAGWREAHARPFHYDYVAGAGADPVADGMDFFARIGPFARALRECDESGRVRLMEALEAHVRAHDDGRRVAFPAAAWIWTATA